MKQLSYGLTTLYVLGAIASIWSLMLYIGK